MAKNDQFGPAAAQPEQPTTADTAEQLAGDADFGYRTVTETDARFVRFVDRAQWEASQDADGDHWDHAANIRQIEQRSGLAGVTFAHAVDWGLTQVALLYAAPAE